LVLSEEKSAISIVEPLNRWSFFEIADVNVGISLAATLLFLAACLGIVWWIFKTGYRLKN
jgi:ABC-2 type transport system permease protein